MPAMRPPRLLLLLVCFIAFPIFLTFLSLLSAHPRNTGSVTAGYGTKSSRLRALFSFHTPASLFPPSAIISLTDDNSTFFLARPAAFGPNLPSDGLSSQLWVGSGFGEDNTRKVGSALGAEGELGCSDVPGWGEGDEKHSDEELSKNQNVATASRAETGAAAVNASGGKTKRAGEEDRTDNTVLDSSAVDSPSENDGTDDHLHHPLPESNPAEAAKPGQPADHEPTHDKSKTPTHADIQSLQESAEIAGKIVLLSRGGCGFLEKVKWVQRRGGVALIVGDDARGGPLITMYARGDTSNVTIPALFTSHTTAHLLSSLIPLETLDDQGPDGGKDNRNKDSKKKATNDDDGPTFTAKGVARPTTPPSHLEKDSKADSPDAAAKIATRSWLGRILSFLGLKGGPHYPWYVAEDSRRPPSSGNIDWVLLEDWDERTSSANSAKAPHQRPSSNTRTDKASPGSTKSNASPKSGADFVIGVQDWRDPDVLNPTENQDTSKFKFDDLASEKPGSTSGGSNTGATRKSEDTETLKGGSITPGSGEYGHSTPRQGGKSGSNAVKPASGSVHHDEDSNGSKDGWLSRLLWSKTSESSTAEPQNAPAEIMEDQRRKSSASAPSAKGHATGNRKGTEEHEGLWVTLTPTTMSTSPFFDTLLVLVVSPLVTLTVVYALLLLRSRIRRRRWRAPKSLVDRLPVRVYHTMSSSSSTTSSQITTPTTLSPTSPLLRSTSRTISPRNRPRSQTTSGVLPSAESSSEGSSAASPPTQEKASNDPIWRKRYTGRQVECVVCLEEYVDGQSRVMSLPCGHEFHVDCM